MSTASAAPVSADPAAQPASCPDAERVPLYADGAPVERICPADVERRGLTVVDLSDGWLPRLFDDDPTAPGGKLDYRAELLALENERLDALPEGHRARMDRYLELYGISPSFGVLRARLLDEARHECHDKVPREPLVRLDQALDAWRKVDEQRGDRFSVADLAARLEHGRDALGKRDIGELASDPQYGLSYKMWQILDQRVSAIAAAQAHLRCDGLLPKTAEDRVIDTPTMNALGLYLRKHAVVTWTLDREAATTMASDSRVLDFRAVLRALRERVVDATGIIEDGSALGAPGTVVGQDLDSDAFDHLAGREPLPGGAPDLVSEATDAAARALGWTTVVDTAAFFGKGEWPARVALKLPAPPRYHGEHMELRAEIDRGDVWYDYPYSGGGARALPSAQRRPVLVLYAKDGAREIPLIRWGTTIGDWKPERMGKTVRMLYKESPIGPRLWRDLVVAPTWIPPESTPVRDLVVPVRGGWRVKRELVGPSYASAYGLVMLVHHVVNGKNWSDQGIRSHGSVSYDSIHQGSSHGCHRLHNHRAVRLAEFLLRHRRHVRRGAEPFPFGRTFALAGKRIELDFGSRGYRYELTPPVPVEVLPGRILGKARRALGVSFQLPANLAQKFMAEMAE